MTNFSLIASDIRYYELLLLQYQYIDRDWPILICAPWFPFGEPHWIIWRLPLLPLQLCSYSLKCYSLPNNRLYVYYFRFVQNNSLESVWNESTTCQQIPCRSLQIWGHIWLIGAPLKVVVVMVMVVKALAWLMSRVRAMQRVYINPHSHILCTFFSA